MPGRTAPMMLCGKRYTDADEAKLSKAMRVPGAELVTGCPFCGGGTHIRGPRTVPALPPPRRATGFPARVKLAVRTRAGMGDPDDAVCESCGMWLGRYGGQVHHLIDRGMGGCTLTMINSPVNAALLCGDPFTGCHGLATAFDAGIGTRGFWLKRGTDPRLKPMTLHGGVLAWRSEDGRYLFDAPGVTAR